MINELFRIFQRGDPLKEMGDNFAGMLLLSHELVKMGGDVYFQHLSGGDELEQIRKQDIQVNKLQRRIRKQVTVHLLIESNSEDLPYCLLLMSLVKDIERVGDYAKDLASLVRFLDEPLPEDELHSQLLNVRDGVESDLEAACEILKSADRRRAIEYIRRGNDLVDLCSALIGNIACSKYNADVAVAMVLGARFYGRIAGHTLNLLSSVVMPLHKLDYHDEKDIAKVASSVR